MENKYALKQIKWFYDVVEQIVLPMVEYKDCFVSLKTKRKYDKTQYKSQLSKEYKCNLCEIDSYKFISIVFDSFYLMKIAKRCKDYDFGIPKQSDIENAYLTERELLIIAEDINDKLYAEYKDTMGITDGDEMQY